jgi:exodeoxyribonuclease VII small subunit
MNEERREPLRPLTSFLLPLSSLPARICYNAREMATRAKPTDFERSFQQLEKIVQRLEGEEMPLDESLQLFEEGIRLSRFCHQRLEEVEKKIELILADAKGQPVVEPFDEDGADDREDEDAEDDSE